MSRFFKSAAFPIVVVVVLAFFAQKMIIDNSGSKQANTWNEFTQAATLGKVQYLKTNLGDNSLKYSVTKADGSQTVTIGIPSTALMDQAISQAQARNSNLVVDGSVTSGSPWWSILVTILPFVLFFAFWIFLMNQMQGGGSKVMSFGKSRAKRMSVDSPKITFKDVAGVDEAVEELHEIKEFLENPKKFQALGARIPKGVLL
ncbi:MAG TPA: hypothetical protein VGP67_00530, partial [Gaiellales bacterium]|nr:hypothetical protein [Gaiellales bacterium]